MSSSPTIPTTMPAYRLIDWGVPPRYAEVPVPLPGPGDVLVKVAGNGLCHSDIGMAHIPAEMGRAIGWHMPFTLGHEIAGTVAALGEGLTGWTEGQQVALVSPKSCGTCRVCLRGLDSACQNGLAGRGYGRDGGLAPYVLATASRDLVDITGLDPLQAGPLTDAGATSYHAVRKVLHLLTPGTTVVVLGAGGLGSFAIQFLRALTPATVIAVDSNPARLTYATELGAHHVLHGVTGDTPHDIRHVVGDGVDAVLDFVGIDDTISAGLRSLRATGAFGLVGAASGSFAGPWLSSLPRDGMVFSFQGSSIADLDDVMTLARAGHVRSDVDLFRWDQVPEAYEALDSGTLRGRAVVTPAA